MSVIRIYFVVKHNVLRITIVVSSSSISSDLSRLPDYLLGAILRGWVLTWSALEDASWLWLLWNLFGIDLHSCTYIASTLHLHCHSLKCQVFFFLCVFFVLIVSVIISRIDTYLNCNSLSFSHVLHSLMEIELL